MEKRKFLYADWSRDPLYEPIIDDNKEFHLYINPTIKIMSTWVGTSIELKWLFGSIGIFIRKKLS